jgi:hypothetical protein
LKNITEQKKRNREEENCGAKYIASDKYLKMSADGLTTVSRSFYERARLKIGTV